MEREGDGSIFIHKTKQIEKIIKQFLGNEPINCTNISIDLGILNTLDKEERNEEKEEK